MTGHARHKCSLKTIIRDVEGHIERKIPRLEYMTRIMKVMNKGKYKAPKELSYNSKP